MWPSTVVEQSAHDIMFVDLNTAKSVKQLIEKEKNVNEASAFIPTNFFHLQLIFASESPIGDNSSRLLPS
jgi:hypothetical protein